MATNEQKAQAVIDTLTSYGVTLTQGKLNALNKALLKMLSASKTPAQIADYVSKLSEVKADLTVANKQLWDLGGDGKLSANEKKVGMAQTLADLKADVSVAAETGGVSTQGSTTDVLMAGSVASVTEGDAAVTYTITGGKPGSTYTWTVDAPSNQSTATAGAADFAVGGGTVKLDATGKGTFTVQAIQDYLQETVETAQVTLWTADGQKPVATQLLTVNQSAIQVTTLTASATSAVEGGTEVTFTVEGGKPNTTYSWVMNGEGNSGTTASDFAVVAGTIALDAAGKGSFKVTATQDFANEVVETAKVTLLDSTGVSIASKLLNVVEDPNLNKTLNIAKASAAGADVMKLTGDQDVRIDFTDPANQIKGLDLDGDGTIEADGKENNITGKASGYEIVDAYARNPLNQGDKVNNFLGDIRFDGTGFDGDGVNTDGNIFLGGLGSDTALGGIGNDFLAGGGGAGADNLQGGRNADFFFAELSLLDSTDGNNLTVDGGSTSDDSAVGNNTPQDSDWLLLEVSDDEDGTVVDLSGATAGVTGEGAQDIITGAGRRIVDNIKEIENVDASGNLYGFLNNVDVKLGGNGHKVGSENVGIGSSAQLNIIGSGARNILIGGFDNDQISGGAGNDLLMGGNLNYLNNPNLAGIKNNGVDEIYGGADSDDTVLELDGGIYEGDNVLGADGGNSDTLWVTKNVFGTQTAADLTSDNTIRLDLGVGYVGGLDNFSGNGGADKNASNGYTADQTNYKTGVVRSTVQDQENIIATGLGAVDYLAAGTNNPELNFNNQQNHKGVGAVNLDLRGTAGANTLYADAGDDKVEGRAGNDNLSGGAGSDDFIFGTEDGTTAIGDAVDVIHRQKDANGDNLWDTDAEGNVLYSKDFGENGVVNTSNSSLTLTLVDNANPADQLKNFPVQGLAFKLGGTQYTVDAGHADTYAGFVNNINAKMDATPALAGLNAVLNANNTITITDPAGATFEAVGYTWVGNIAPAAGTLSWNMAIGAAQVSQTHDRLIYQSYEDRADGEKTDDDAVTGSTISLGQDAYAEDLEVSFSADGTRITEDQAYQLTFSNLTTEDKVTIEVNGVKYSLQVGVDLDGNSIAAEDGVGDAQPAIQAAFLTRLTAFINTFMDNDTASGSVGAALAGSTITLTQNAYNGEETVFMSTPVVTLGNQSGGEKATVTVANVSQHEVHLLDFDGRNGALNRDNVLFLGDTGTNRAIFETAKDAGGELKGLDAVVVDGGANDLAGIANNTATNAALAINFSVHGDDYLIGGKGNDSIVAGTGDDRVRGSEGNDTADGGKNYYAVKVLGETEARVVQLNVWEAANPTKVAALNGLTISSITLINQSENGTGTVSGLFDDTLVFHQADFTAGKTQFTVTLNDYVMNAGVVELQHGGAGTVAVDKDGNGAAESTTIFRDFENVRTVSGIGNAVAGDGQGNDTLNVVNLSNVTTGAGGISYDLTNTGSAGEVRYSANAHASATRPVAGDFESLVMKVDGVENVLTGTGNDLLLIDETEAAKNNSFSANLGADRIEYQDVYAGDVGGVAQPTVTIKVNTATDTDTVSMTGGRVGTTVATDTLTGVEFITLAGNVAEGSREDDVLDVTTMAAGAVVDYTNGEVRTAGSVAGTGVQVTIEGINEIEKVWADGNDTVIVADATIMGANSREDGSNGTPSEDVAFSTFMDFDTLKTPGTDNTRKAFATQTTAEIENVVNQNEFKFDLSKVGTDADSDTVDYSNAVDNISVVVELDATKANQYVLVDSDGTVFYDGAGDLAEADDRVDMLTSVERIVASAGEAVLDLTASTKGVEIKYQPLDVANRVAALDRDVYNIQISDLASAVPLTRNYVEYRDAGLLAPTVALPDQVTAAWDRIEGSDFAERVIMNSAHSTDNNTFNLRGGANEVKYNELTRSITTTLYAQDFSASNPLGTAVTGYVGPLYASGNTAANNIQNGSVMAVTQFQDGNGAALAGGGTHVATAYTANNGIAVGSLRIAASQDAEDTLSVAGTTDKLFLLAETGTTDNQITLKIGSGAAQNTMILTGYEILQDAASNDVYDLGNISNVIVGLDMTDSTADHDTVKVGNDGINFNASGVNTIDLDNISATVGGIGMDFDVLDITKVTTSGLTVNGGTNAAPANADVDATDELVVGALSKINTVNDFEALVLTQDSVAAGTTFTLNTTTNTLTQGSTIVTLNNGLNSLSAGGLVFENELTNSYVADVTSAVIMSATGSEAVTLVGGSGADVITGAGGADLIVGGAGADVLNGGTATEVRQIQLDGILSGAAGGSVAVTFNGFTAASTTVTEGAEIVAGAGSDAVGAALAIKLNANIAAINAGAAWTGGASLANVSYDAGTDLLTFTFNTGTDVADGEVISVASAGDAGTFNASAQTVATQGTDGGVDTFKFAATAAANGADIINGFVAANGASDDLLDFTAFLGGAATTGGAAVNGAAADVNLAVNNVGVLYGKSSLVATDVKLVATAANGEVLIADNGKAVVLVSADADGVADATNNAYSVYYVQDTDTTAAQNFVVTLVGTVNSTAELTAANLFAGTDAFV